MPCQALPSAASHGPHQRSTLHEKVFLVFRPLLASLLLLLAACNKNTGAPTPANVAPVGVTTASVRSLDNMRAPNPAKLANIGFGEGVAYSAASLGVSYAITKHLSATADVASGFGKMRNVYSGVQSTFGAAVEW